MIELISKDGRKFLFIFPNSHDRNEALRLYNAITMKTFYDDKSSVEKRELFTVTFAKVYHHAILYGHARNKKEKEDINNQTNASEFAEMNKNAHAVYIHHCDSGCKQKLS